MGPGHEGHDQTKEVKPTIPKGIDLPMLPTLSSESMLVPAWLAWAKAKAQTKPKAPAQAAPAAPAPAQPPPKGAQSLMKA